MRALLALLLLLIACAAAAPAGAAASEGLAACSPLGRTSGGVIDVGPSDAARLPEIVSSAPARATIRLADGTYPVPGGLRVEQRGITLRSASGDPERVVIDGEYGPSALVAVAASSVTVADVTLTRAQDHLVHAVPRERARSISGLRLHRVRLIDSGEQFVKANPNASRTGFVHRARITCSEFEMTATGRTRIERAFGCYTGGIDAHGARGWSVRRNTFVGIYCEDGEVAEHAIHLWRGARDSLVENNHIVNCSRGIGFGLTADRADGHRGGVIRRNAIVADIPQYDTGIELAHARGTRVVHNTVAETPRATSAFSSIDLRFAGTSAVIVNNLVRRITTRDGGRGRMTRNIVGYPVGEWLVDAAGGDVHLRRGAGAVDRGARVRGAGRDLDGAVRARGRPDVGADELVP